MVRQSSAMACTARPLLSTKFTQMSRCWRSARGTKRRWLCGFPLVAALADDLVGEATELAGCE